MANLQVTWSYRIKDALGVSVSFDDTVMLIPDTTTLATLQTITNSLTDVIDPVTDGMIDLITIKIDANIVGAKSAPNTDAEVERTGLFNYSQDTVSRKYALDLPAIARAVIADGKIDVSNADVVAFFQWFTAAHSGGTVVSKFLYALDALLDVAITFRKHRRPETRRSLEVAP